MYFHLLLQESQLKAMSTSSDFSLTISKPFYGENHMKKLPQEILFLLFKYWFNAEMPIERGTSVVTMSYYYSYSYSYYYHISIFGGKFKHLNRKNANAKWICKIANAKCKCEMQNANAKCKCKMQKRNFHPNLKLSP